MYKIMHLLRQIFDRYILLKHTVTELEQTFECRNLLKISIRIYLSLSDLLKQNTGDVIKPKITGQLVRPKEQIPNNLSGKRTVRINSGKRLSSRRRSKTLRQQDRGD